MTQHEFETQVKWLYKNFHENFGNIVHWILIYADEHHWLPGSGWRICFNRVPFQILAFIHALNIETEEDYAGMIGRTLFKIKEEQLILFKQMKSQINILREFE